MARCLPIHYSLVLFGKMLVPCSFTLFAKLGFSVNCFSSNGTRAEFNLEAKRHCIPVHSQLGYHVSCSGIQVEAVMVTLGSLGRVFTVVECICVTSRLDE